MSEKINSMLISLTIALILIVAYDVKDMKAAYDEATWVNSAPEVEELIEVVVVNSTGVYTFYCPYYEEYKTTLVNVEVCELGGYDAK